MSPNMARLHQSAALVAPARSHHLLVAHPAAPRARPCRTQVAASVHSSVVAAAAVATIQAPRTARTVEGPSSSPALARPSDDQRVKEINPENFMDFLHDAGDRLCVIDYYTDWCGPCKVMAPEFDKMQAAFKNVRFAKLNCSQCQEFSSRQRIRSLPTFRVYYKGRCLDEVTGAKPVQLRQLLTHWQVMTSIRNSGPTAKAA